MYLIPRKISKRFEFFPGWGWKELFVTIASGGIGFGVSFLIGIFISSPERYLFVLFFIALGYLSTQPVMPDGSTALDMIMCANRFRKSKKLYLYRKGGI